MEMSQKRIISGILFILAIAAGVGAYFWHQERKSNHGERETNLADYSQYPVATFAGGCFWCSESDFEKTVGVVEAVSGYTGGDVENPSYKEVSSGTTGHRESVQVYYDPSQVTYEQLLDVFWRHIDPTDGGGQFNDRGMQYSPAIFYHDDDQKRLAEESKKQLEESGKFSQVNVPILPFKEFFVAEDYHQNYYKKNSLSYGYYRKASGRDAYIEKTWGDGLHEAQMHGSSAKSVSDALLCDFSGKNYKAYSKPLDAQLRKILPPLVYDVTQKEGTERAFDNAYWNNEEEGIYVDALSGEPLFSSADKYDSGTGWPSFVKPISDGAITLNEDTKLFLPRTEVRSKISDSHLGHVFDDGPKDRGGKRYCMNSAAMCFISKADMQRQGYGEYLEMLNEE